MRIWRLCLWLCHRSISESNLSHMGNDGFLKGVKSYTFPVIKLKGHGNLMYSIVTIVNNIILCI